MQQIITKNYEITTVDDNDKSSEGGVIEYYSRNGELKKIVTKYYGEGGKSITEYYVKNNNNIYFIYDVDYHYNAPPYIKETFDKKKTEIKEKRYYFDSDGNLIRYIDENKKIIEDKEKLHDIKKEIHKNIEEIFLKNKTNMEGSSPYCPFPFKIP